MKNIFRALMMAIVMTALTAATATTSYAQDPEAEKAALYETYTKNYNSKDIEKVKIAIAAAKEYIEKYSAADYVAKYGDTPEGLEAKKANQATIDYFKDKALPPLEKRVAAVAKGAEVEGVVKRFNDSFPAGRYDETYASGKQLLAENPENVDIIIVLGSIGYDESLKATPNTKYNADSINYSKQAIQKIEANAKTTDYGAFTYAYGDYLKFPGTTKTDKYPGRDNALGNLNYKIGYLMYFNQNQKKEAIPYFYKASKYDSSVKNLPIIYQVIGDSYFEEAKRLNAESERKAKEAGNKDTDESKADDAMAKGYADRAIDAYARAYKMASTNQGVKKEYKDGLYKLLQELFKFRFNGKIEGLDSYVATVMNKPFVDPTTAVTPVVVEATPAATTTSTSSSLSATSNTTVSATPTSTGGSTAKAGTAAAASTAATKTAPAAKAKAPAKKPVVKKKGTR